MLVGPFRDFSARAKAMIKKRVAVFFSIVLLLSAGASLSLAQVIHDPDEPALLTNIVLAKVDGGLDVIKFLFRSSSSPFFQLPAAPQR